jgi:hypothetical protein
MLVLPPMGQTAECEVEIDGTRDRGQLLLETAELIFRGATRLRIPFSAMRTVAAAAGALRIEWRRPTAGAARLPPAGTIVISLGARAEAWASKIKNPPARIDKLGVKPQMKVALWGAIDPEAVAEIRARAGADVVVGKPRGGEALIFVAVERPADLGRIAAAAEKMAPDGAIWLIRRKGKETAVSESESMAAGRAAGLTDTKVVGFSATHSAERYVIPVARRPVKAKASRSARSA